MGGVPIPFPGCTRVPLHKPGALFVSRSSSRIQRPLRFSTKSSPGFVMIPPTYLVSSLQILNTGTNLNHGASNAVAEDLRMLNEQSSISLV